MESEKNENIEELNDKELNEVAGGEGHTVIQYHCHLCGDYYNAPGTCPIHPWVQLEKVTREY